MRIGDVAVKLGDHLARAPAAQNALGMGINFKTYQMSAGAELFVYSERQPGTVRGSFTAANHKLYGGLSVMPVVGDTVVVEVFAPDGVSAPVVEVESIVHHYKNTMFRTNADRSREAAAKAALPMDGKSKVEQPQCFGCSGDCNVNAVNNHAYRLQPVTPPHLAPQKAAKAGGA